VSGQYADLDDGRWTYDIAANTWSGGELMPADSRTYRSGPFHPDYYLQGEPPNAEAFAAWLAKLPANEWVATNPPYRPRLNRDWGCARLDPDRDLLLRWSGGHSAHGGTDVPHFHFATNRWELCAPVEFPLGQLYSNTSYPDGYNFNLRPWITGHTYQNYAYDPPSKTMIFAGRPKHSYIYDPARGDWVGRSEKPKAMQYNSCFYTLTLTATPDGAVCWDKQGRVHRYDHRTQAWREIDLSGDKLPGAYVDNSTITYDSVRDRALIFPAAGYQTPYDGQVYAVDMKTGAVRALSPAGMDAGPKFAYIDRCCYDPTGDLVLIASYLKDSGDHTPTPVYDCRTNGWRTLDLKYGLGERYGKTTRAFPHGRSCPPLILQRSVGVPGGHVMGAAAIAIGALPPLARLVGKISLCDQRFDQARVLVKRLANRQVELRSIVAAIDIVASHAVLMRIKPGDDRGQRRAAKGRGDISSSKHQTALGQPIEIGRLDFVVAHETVVGPTLVIAEDEHDIRRRGAGGTRTERNCDASDEQQRET
jgi:hypothetical protein